MAYKIRTREEEGGRRTLRKQMTKSDQELIVELLSNFFSSTERRES